MKKIFIPLLALCGMVASLTLTSCGGGGGGNNKFSGKAIRYYGNTIAGSMLVQFLNKKTDDTYSVLVSFGEDGTSYSGEFMILEDSETPVVSIQLDGDDTFSTDEGVRMFFADFLPPEFDADGPLYGFPKPKITMTYTTNTSGTYVATYTFIIADDPETKDVNEGDDPETTEIETSYEDELNINGLTFSYEDI